MMHEISRQNDPAAPVEPPKAVFIELTSHCNMHCTFCPSDVLRRKKEHLADSRLRSFLDQLHVLNMHPPILCNVLGEPLLNKKLYEYLDLFEQHGHLVTLITNMTLLADKVVQREILKHNNLTLALSLQTATKESFRKRGYPRLAFEDFFRLIFDVIEEKFRMGSSARLEIHVASNYVVSHDPTIKTDSPLNIWPNFPSEKAEQRWIRKTLAGLEKFSRTIQKKYPRAFEDEKNFSLQRYRDHIGSRVAVSREMLPKNYYRLKDEVFWGYMFMPNVFLVFKSLELWTRDRSFIKSAIPQDKRVFIEENAESRTCIMAENLGLLSNGDFVLCCLDYEGEMKLGNIDTTRVEDVLRSEKRTDIRRNAMTQGICRRCKGRVFIFDTSPLSADEQIVDKWGAGWWTLEPELYGLGGRWTKGTAQSYIFVRVPARRIAVNFLSVHEDTGPLRLSLWLFDETAEAFIPEKEYVFYGKKGVRAEFKAAFDFSPQRLYKIEISSPTFIPDEVSGSGDKRNLGLAVFRIRLLV